MFSSASMIVRPKHNNMKSLEEAANKLWGSGNAVRQSIDLHRQSRSNLSRTRNFEIYTYNPPASGRDDLAPANMLRRIALAERLMLCQSRIWQKSNSLEFQS